MRNCKFICLPCFDFCNRERKHDCWQNNNCWQGNNCWNNNNCWRNNNHCWQGNDCWDRCERDCRNIEFRGNIRFRECNRRFDNKFDNRNHNNGCGNNYPEFWTDNNFGNGGFNDFNGFNGY
ncbi:MAG: hypothetical protein ACI4TX_02950 [Christensenellales bacterium]